MAYDRGEHIIGHGKRLAYSDTENGTYLPVYGTIDVDLPDRELGKSELTNDDSVDNTKDYRTGMYEPGAVPFTYRYGKTMYAALEVIFNKATDPATLAQATKWWRVTLPDGAISKGQGFLTKHKLPMQGQEDSAVVDAEIQAVGKWAFTAVGGS